MGARVASTLISALVTFGSFADNSLVVHARCTVMEGMIVFFIFLSLLSLLKLRNLTNT